MTVEFRGKEWDDRHGGPFDRGAADSWYWRPTMPHYFKEGTHTSEMVNESGMTDEEVEAYYAGYDWNDQFGGKKDWGVELPEDEEDEDDGD